MFPQKQDDAYIDCHILGGIYTSVLRAKDCCASQHDQARRTHASRADNHMLPMPTL